MINDVLEGDIKMERAETTRDQEWKKQRFLNDAQSMLVYESSRVEKEVELSRCLMSSISIKPLHLLILKYATPRPAVWLAHRRLLTILALPIRTPAFLRKISKKTIEQLLSEIDEDELVQLEKQISDIDPLRCDDDEGSYEIYQNRSDIRFNPGMDLCGGCRRSAWSEVFSVQGNTHFELKRSVGKYTLGPDDNFLTHWVCNACKDFCACTPIKLKMYNQRCTICHVTKCQLHDFKRFLKANPLAGALWMSNPHYQCDACLETLELGRALSTILASPHPINAFAQYISAPK